MRREYTMDEKAAALAVYVEKGVAEAWRQTGIPKPTIASWARRGNVHSDAPAKTIEAVEAARVRSMRLREELRYRLLEKAADLLDRMDAEHVDFKGKDVEQVVYPIAPASAVQNYATSVGILIDKFRLEMGEATGRTEHHEITDDLPADVKRTLRDRLARLAAEEATGTDAGELAEAPVAGMDP